MLLSGLRIATEITRPIRPPQWEDNIIILDCSPFYLLRKFQGSEPRRNEVVFLCPPYAGRSGTIASKLIRCCQNLGFDVLVFELLPARNGETHLSDLIHFISDCYDYTAAYDSAIAVGACQGAWALAIAISLLRAPIFSPLAYFNFAGPLDFTAGQGSVRQLVKNTPLVALQANVHAFGGVRNRWQQWAAFASLNPYAVTVGEFMRLVRCVMRDDKAGIAKWHRDRDWYWSPQHLSGGWYLEAVEWLFMQNRLIKGELYISGRRVELGRITCPVYLYAGGKDEITTPEQLWGVEKALRPGMPIHKRLFEDCGHTAVFNRDEPMSQFTKDLMDIVQTMDVVQTMDSVERS